MTPLKIVIGVASGLIALNGHAARAQTEVRLGVLSPEITAFCLSPGGLLEPAFSPFPAEVPGVKFRKIQVSISQAPVVTSSGDIDMAECAGPDGLIQAWRKGAKNAVMVFVATPKPAYVLIGGKNIKSMRDLEGKTVGSPGPQSTAGQTAITILQRGAGLAEGKDYKIVSTGAGSARDAALAAGKIDAIPSFAPLSYKLVDEGLNQIGDLADYVKYHVTGTILVNKTWAEKNSDALVAILKSFVQTGRWLRDPANKDAVLASLASRVMEGPAPMGAEHAKRFYHDIIEQGRISVDGYAPPEAFMSNLEIMTERGAIKKEEYPSLRELVDYSYLNRALQELGSPPVPAIR